MRVAIALCFSVVFRTVYTSPSPTDDLEDLKLQIKNAIWKVESTMQEIERIHTDTTENTISAVTKKWWEHMDNHRDYVNLLLESMRREVNNAKVKGIDAQDCYDTNSWAMTQHTEAAYKAGIKCQEDAEKSIESRLKFLDNLKSHGDELIKELNDIFRKCYDENTEIMKGCILSELNKVNTAVKEFEEDAKNIEYNALPASNYVVLQASQCLTNGYLIARFESQGSLMSNYGCVQDKIEKKETDSLVA